MGALARTATLEWAHVNQFFFSSTDGRDSEKSLYTGGGDMGEFVQSLIAYQGDGRHAGPGRRVGSVFQVPQDHVQGEVLLRDGREGLLQARRVHWVPQP